VLKQKPAGLAMGIEIGARSRSADRRRKSKQQNRDRILPTRCLATYALHIPFKLDAIKRALNNWPAEFREFDAKAKSAGGLMYQDTAWYKPDGTLAD
jgi:hypothetical protein